jgi:hypothetical protein
MVSWAVLLFLRLLLLLTMKQRSSHVVVEQGDDALPKLPLPVVMVVVVVSIVV